MEIYVYMYMQAQSLSYFYSAVEGEKKFQVVVIVAFLVNCIKKWLHLRCMPYIHKPVYITCVCAQVAAFAELYYSKQKIYLCFLICICACICIQHFIVVSLLRRFFRYVVFFFVVTGCVSIAVRLIKTKKYDKKITKVKENAKRMEA